MSKRLSIINFSHPISEESFDTIIKLYEEKHNVKVGYAEIIDAKLHINDMRNIIKEVSKVYDEARSQITEGSKVVINLPGLSAAAAIIALYENSIEGVVDFILWERTGNIPSKFIPVKILSI